MRFLVEFLSAPVVLSCVFLTGLQNAVSELSCTASCMLSFLLQNQTETLHVYNVFCKNKCWRQLDSGIDISETNFHDNQQFFKKYCVVYFCCTMMHTATWILWNSASYMVKQYKNIISSSMAYVFASHTRISVILVMPWQIDADICWSETGFNEVVFHNHKMNASFSYIVYEANIYFQKTVYFILGRSFSFCDVRNLQSFGLRWN